MPDHPCAPASLAECRVLVTDDDAIIRHVYGEVLRGQGCEVAEAADGAECARMASEIRPHLVLMDLNMPGTDGWAGLAGLRAGTGFEQPVVVAVSADAGEATRRRVLEAGFDAFVHKPLTPASMVRLVDAAWRDACARRRGDSARPPLLTTTAPFLLVLHVASALLG